LTAAPKRGCHATRLPREKSDRLTACRNGTAEATWTRSNPVRGKCPGRLTEVKRRLSLCHCWHEHWRPNRSNTFVEGLSQHRSAAQPTPKGLQFGSPLPVHTPKGARSRGASSSSSGRPTQICGWTPRLRRVTATIHWPEPVCRLEQFSAVAKSGTLSGASAPDRRIGPV